MNISLFFFTMQRETFSWWVSNNQEQQQQQNIHNIKEIIAIVISENIEWEMVTAAVHHHHLTLCSHSQFELWMEYTKWIEITECDATGAAEYAFSHNVNIRIAQIEWILLWPGRNSIESNITKEYILSRYIYIYYEHWTLIWMTNYVYSRTVDG